MVSHDKRNQNSTKYVILSVALLKIQVFHDVYSVLFGEESPTFNHHSVFTVKVMQSQGRDDPEIPSKHRYLPPNTNINKDLSLQQRIK
jgi:hypothetical protein